MAIKRLLSILCLLLIAATVAGWRGSTTLLTDIATIESELKPLTQLVLGVSTGLPSGETVSASDSAVLVSRVIDGDTFELSTGEKVRYIGIDTPETKHPTKKEECFGQSAYIRNQELIEGKWIVLEKDVSQTDRYGRLLRYVWLDGQLINQQLVAEGYAYASSFPPDVRYQDILQAAQQQAQLTNAGLWGTCRE